MNNKSKKIAAACLALAMVASIGAADVAGVLPVVNTVTASAESSNKLADGEYYVNVTDYNNFEMTNTVNGTKFAKYAKLKVENGKYYATLTYTKNASNSILLFEKVKNERYSETSSTPGYAKGLLPEGYDVDSSPFSKSIKRKIADNYNDMFEKIDYTFTDDNTMQFTVELDPDTSSVFINGLYTFSNDAGKLYGSSFSDYVYFDVENAYTIPDNIFTDYDQTVSFNYEELMGSSTNVGHAFKYTTVHAKAENGKLSATFYYNQDAINEKSDETFIGAVFKDPDGNVVKLNDDNSFTVVYDSVESILNGVNYYADVSYYQLKNDENGTHKIPAVTTKTLNFRLDLAVKPVKLTDPTTGVSLYTTTKYVSENATLVSSDVPTDSVAYKTMAEHCENLYNDMLFKKYYIVDNGKIVDTTGQYLIMDFPIKENQNKLGLSVYLAAYEEEYDYWGWMICGADTDSYYKGYQVDNDTYRLITSDISIDGYVGFFDKKDSTATGENLEDGTYEVPITILNEVNPSATSMAASCVGSTAKLVVKDGRKRLELDYKCVELEGLNGYLIQMWNQVNGDWREVNYTSYYKNEDGSYFTDDLNKGTNNYYPKTAYIELPNDAGQFKAKFRVSAMDYIMGNTGDATRNGIFTIYYDEAKKISDETPDPDPIEDPDFEPVDMTALTDLVAKAEQYNEDDYTTSTFTTMKNALASAKVVLANSRATQEEVDSAFNELQAAVNALEEKKDVTIDINNLPDGKYQLYAQMIKTDRESFSMSN